MKNYLDIEEMILFNQTVQGIVSMQDLVNWFKTLVDERQRLVLFKIADMINHARPLVEDGLQAVKDSGLKATYTPCVIIRKSANREQLGKLCLLPVSERAKALILLVSLFRIADQRRRTGETDGIERHWWHQDLNDAAVLEDIRRRYRDGQL